MSKKMWCKWTKIPVPVKVGWVKPLQPSQFLVDDFQLRLKELDLLRIWGHPFQLFQNLFSYLQVLIMNGVQILVQRLKIYQKYIYTYQKYIYTVYIRFITCFLWNQFLFFVVRSAKMDFIYLQLYSSYIFSIFNCFCKKDLAINTYLQVVDMDWTLMHTVISQGNMEMTGETRFGQLQPATKFLQTTEQDKADVRAGWGSDTGGFLFRGFSLHHFFPFNGWWKFDRILTVNRKNSSSFGNSVD